MARTKSYLTRLSRLLLHLVIVLIGNAILAFGISCFAVPANLILGGASGIGLIVEQFAPISLSTCVFAINIVMLIVGFIFIGKEFAAGTVLSSFAFPFFLALFERIESLQHITNDILLSAIYAGIFIGLGLGLVIRLGYSTGGMDIPPILINKKTGMSIGALTALFDVLILCGQIPFSSFEGVLYGIITVVISNYLLDKLLMLGESNIQVIIISAMHEELAQMIFDKIDRGCTYLNITTGYMHNDQKAILAVISKRQYADIHEHIQQIDSTAFIIANEVHSVKGRGFTLPNIDIEL